MTTMARDEKLPLMGPRHTTANGPVYDATARPRSSRWPRIWAALLALGLLKLCWTMSALSPYFPLHRHHHHQPSTDDYLRQQCLQADALFPSKHSDALTAMDEFLASPQFFNASVPRLAGAVQIPTQSYDDMGVIGEDPRWDVMYDLSAYLEATFPLVHSTLRLDRVNTHGRLYTWQGSEPALKPTILMAHQDTVPVEKSTISQWTHPPFSGAFDGRFVWGRGASDCKNSLIGILEAVEALVDAGFRPRRTLVLSFGFDEEISGAAGAGHLASALLGRYGKDGAAVVVDEGNGLVEQWGTLFGAPAVAEKGYIDVDVVVRMPGGHSSVPPRHNGIGVMGEIITAVEANLYDPHLHDENPFLGALYCGAAHAAEFPHKLRKELGRRRGTKDHHRGAEVCEKKDSLALEAAKASDLVKYMFTTSVAADLISGGAKINALPERTVLTVNHRVNVGDRTQDVKDRLTAVAGDVARKFNLTLHAFPEGDDEGETPSSVTLKVAFGAVLEPAPVSPTEVVEGEDNAWSVLAGTTRAVYGEELIMAPGLSTGNTDTKFYWDLTRNIYRYVPAYDEEESGLGNIHTVDERASMVGHVRAVRWYSLFVRNMDEANIE